MSEHVPEILEQLAALEQELQSTGIAPEQIRKAYQQLEQYLRLKESLEQSRSTQFEDEAYQIAVKMSAASNKNVRFLAGVLREFAEHVAGHAFSLQSHYPAVVDLVDHVPPLYPDEQESFPTQVQKGE